MSTSVTLTGPATLAQFQACFDSATYENTSQDPTDLPDRTIDFVVNDGTVNSNIATATAQAGTGGTFTTDASGFGIIDVVYPQEFATWVDVTLEATTSVQGTEFAEASEFRLPINGEDIDDLDIAPPGIVSPFGDGTDSVSQPPLVTNTCFDTF